MYFHYNYQVTMRFLTHGTSQTPATSLSVSAAYPYRPSAPLVPIAQTVPDTRQSSYVLPVPIATRLDCTTTHSVPRVMRDGIVLGKVGAV